MTNYILFHESDWLWLSGRKIKKTEKQLIGETKKRKHEPKKIR